MAITMNAVRAHVRAYMRREMGYGSEQSRLVSISVGVFRDARPDSSRFGEYGVSVCARMRSAFGPDGTESEYWDMIPLIRRADGCPNWAGSPGYLPPTTRSRAVARRWAEDARRWIAAQGWPLEA